MSAETSGGEFRTACDPVAILKSCEDILYATPDGTTLAKCENELRQTVDRLRAEWQDHTDNQNCYYLRESALWCYCAETARLQLVRGLEVVNTNIVRINEEMRERCIIQIRKGLDNCRIAAQGMDDGYPKTIISYLRNRTLGAAELVHALTAPPCNHGSRNFFRAQEPLRKALLALNDLCKPRNDGFADMQLDDPNHYHNLRDPDLNNLYELQSGARDGRHTYLVEQPPKKNIAATALRHLLPHQRRPRRVEHHMLTHPAFSNPAPYKITGLLNL